MSTTGLRICLVCDKAYAFAHSNSVDRERFCSLDCQVLYYASNQRPDTGNWEGTRMNQDMRRQQELIVDFTHEGGRVRPRQNVFRDKIWLDRSGDLIPIDEMSDPHIQNALGLCKQFDGWSKWVPIFEEEIVRRKTQEKLPERKLRIK